MGAATLQGESFGLNVAIAPRFNFEGTRELAIPSADFWAAMGPFTKAPVRPYINPKERMMNPKANWTPLSKQAQLRIGYYVTR